MRKTHRKRPPHLDELLEDSTMSHVVDLDGDVSAPGDVCDRDKCGHERSRHTKDDGMGWETACWQCKCKRFVDI